MEILFDLDQKKQAIQDIEHLMTLDGFWDDNKKANVDIATMNQLKNTVDAYTRLNTVFDNLQEAVEMMKNSFDQDMKDLIEMEYYQNIKLFNEFEVAVLLSHDYDK